MFIVLSKEYFLFHIIIIIMARRKGPVTNKHTCIYKYNTTLRKDTPCRQCFMLQKTLFRGLILPESF